MKSWVQVKPLTDLEVATRWILYGFLGYVESSPKFFPKMLVEWGVYTSVKYWV